MGAIFLSYRRDDSADVAGRIYDRLVARFGARDIFIDVDSIPPGANFADTLRTTLETSDVMLVIIGRSWLGPKLRGRGHKIDDQGDFVRIEVELALRKGIRIIPLLVSGASMPGAKQLPSDLRPLVLRQALPVGHNPNFHRDMDHVITAIEAATADAEKQRAEEAERVQKARAGTEALRSGLTDGVPEGRITALLGTVAKYVLRSLRRVFVAIVMMFIVIGVAGAAVTELVGARMVGQFPANGATNLTAVVIGVLSGGLAAMTMSLVQLLRSIVLAIELVVREAERLAAESIATTERLEREVSGQSST